MAVTQKVTLYNNKFTVPPVINAVQNDTDRQVEAYFGDFTLQVGMTGKLSFIRSDGTHYEASATLNTGANTATAELDQALTQAGVTQAQLKITDSGDVGSTFTFLIKVQPDVAGISVPQDGWSAQEFYQRLTDAENAIDAVEEDVVDLQDKEYDYAPVITDSATGAIATFQDGADGVPVKDLQVSIEAVQSGSGDPSPDNVRPITGFSQAKVTRTGKNLYDPSTKTETSNNTYNILDVKANTDYVFSVDTQQAGLYVQYLNGESWTTLIFKYDATWMAFNTGVHTQIRIMTFKTNSQQTPTEFQLELGSTATDYEPYNGQTVTIDLDGTRYGGVLDVTKGKLTVTMAEVDLGDLSWSYNAQYKMFYRALTNASFNENHILTSQYGIFTSFTDLIADVTKDGAYKSTDNNHSLYIRDIRYEDPAVFKTAMSGVQLVYELDNPVEVDLTPTELETILGTNNVFADCGNVTVEYGADTKRYIQKLISQLA